MLSECLPVQSENLICQIFTNLKAFAWAGTSRTSWMHWLCNSETLFKGLAHHQSSSAPLLQHKNRLCFEWGTLLQKQNIDAAFLAFLCNKAHRLMPSWSCFSNSFLLSHNLETSVSSSFIKYNGHCSYQLYLVCLLSQGEKVELEIPSVCPSVHILCMTTQYKWDTNFHFGLWLHLDVRKVPWKTQVANSKSKITAAIFVVYV